MRSRSRRWRVGAALAVVLIGVSPALADFHAGVEAYERGDAEAALREWLPLAERDHIEAQYWLGRLYSGSTATADPAEALRWYTRAAGLGHAAARNNLGRIYELGRGVPANTRTAFNWYLAAAEAGLPVAQANVARLYDTGAGVTRNPTEAVRWYRSAAESGHAEARYRLGLIYLEGRGVRADPEAGRRWIKRAAKLGHEEALRALENPPRAIEEAAEIDTVAEAAVPPAVETPTPSSDDPDGLYARARDLAVGHGTTRNPGRASELFERAARQGHGPAAYRLALLFRHGDVPGGVDLVRAYAWMGVASTRGVGDASGWLERMARRMNESERDEARRLADELDSD